MKELISIIVPIYNSARYIRECVNSVLEQTYENFELILIDDGSLDESKDICLKLRETDRRILFFHQEHKGVSAARNIGLKTAKGKYLFYLDSDDIIHPNLLETLYDELEKTNSIMAVSQFHFIKDMDKKDQLISMTNREKTSFTYIEKSKVLEYFLDEICKEFTAMPGKMILRSSVQTFYFDESLSHGEDTKYIYQILLSGSDAVILHPKWYFYRNHSGNSSKIHSLKAYNSMYECKRYMCDKEKECGRIKSAAIQEQAIMNHIMEWNTKSRYLQDQIMMEYLSKLAADERKLEIYSYTSLSHKIKFSLAFYCFPLYWIYCDILYVLGKIKAGICLLEKSSKRENGRYEE